MNAMRSNSKSFRLSGNIVYLKCKCVILVSCGNFKCFRGTWRQKHLENIVFTIHSYLNKSLHISNFQSLFTTYGENFVIFYTILEIQSSKKVIRSNAELPHISTNLSYSKGNCVVLSSTFFP